MPSRSPFASIETLEKRQLLSASAGQDFMKMEQLDQPAALPAAAVQTNLVSDGAVVAAHTDSELVNPWGLAIGPTGVLWPSNAGTGTSTAYTGSGQSLGELVTIPTPSGTGTAIPTGVVANNTSGFQVSQNDSSGASLFIYATIQGVIAGWSPAVSSSNAIIAVNQSSTDASYTGLAIAGEGAQRKIYAADFGNSKIEVFNSTFQSRTTNGDFTDPNLPSGYAPFNIERLDGMLFVTYAVKDPSSGRDVAGVGNGIVDVYGKGGVFKQRLATGGTLNAPWGVALAPATWSKSLANRILVGNFGDGKVNVFNLTGKVRGQLLTSNDQPLDISGLWSLTNGVAGTSNSNTLFFTAGINGEADGLLGTITD